MVLQAAEERNARSERSVAAGDGFVFEKLVGRLVEYAARGERVAGRGEWTEAPDGTGAVKNSEKIKFAPLYFTFFAIFIKII